MDMYKRRTLLAGLFLVAATSLSSGVHAQEKVIRFAYQKNLFMAPIFAAFEKGWFDEALKPLGYQMVRREIGVGPAIAEAMAADQIDIGELGVAVAVTAAGRGLPLKIVCNNGIAGEGVVVRADSPAKTLADLRGKTIAIPAKGSLPDFILRYGLQKNGLDPTKDVKFVEIAGPDQKQALMSGLVDAVVIWEPLVTDFVRAGGRILATGQEIYPNHENDTISATDDAIKHHPEAVRAIVQAVVKGQGWVIDNPEEAIDISAKYLGLKREVIAQAWPNVLRARDGKTSVANTQAFADALKEWGYIRTKVDATALIDNQFLAKKAAVR